MTHQTVAESRTPAVLRRGFRPFFLIAGLYAALSMLLWTFWMHGDIHIDTAFTPFRWHAHEMIFGFVMAAAVGFLLTAVPNWTGRLPLRGWPLASLVALWLAGRIAVWFSASIGPATAAVIDLAFGVVVAAVIAREVVAGQNWRNLFPVVALTILVVANLLSHLEVLGLAWTGSEGLRLGIATMVLLISQIGGRVVPSFTRNWLAKSGDEARPVPFNALDRVIVAVTVPALALWIVAPTSSLTAALAAAAALAHLVRLARWRGWRTWREPLVWSLHLGYLWVAIGFALVAATPVAVGLPTTLALHAFTAGAMATMILAIMTRATLGHTGQDLAADLGTFLIYLLVTIAALARIAAPAWPEFYIFLIAVAGLAWIAGFALFTILFGPALVLPRADGKDG